jgi:predicted lipid-binding transport protein (Tim44 family)
MSNSFQSIDIILFAMIALFLAIRLRSVLGRRDGNDPVSKRELETDKNNSSKTQNVIELTDVNKVKKKNSSKDEDANDNVTNLEPVLHENLDQTPMTQELSKLEDLDASFTSENFVVGARVAFEMILKSFAAGDTETLKNLLSNEVYSNFDSVIKEREREGHLVEDTLVGITTAELVEVYLNDQDANITVKFTSDQIKVCYDKDQKILDGDPKTVIVVTDFWTFSRDLRNNNPNWTLVATRSLD